MTTTASSSDLLTPEQVCVMLGGVTTKTLREWNVNHRHRELLAPIRFTHRIVRYKREAVNAFIERCSSDFGRK